MTWYKKADFPQYNVFHGTRNQQSIYDNGFICDYLGQGNDQYGPGFYFTTSYETASEYKEYPGQTGGEGSPGVIKAKVKLNKPIRVNSRNVKSSVFDIFPILNSSAVREIINLAIRLRGPQILEDWGDVKFEGKEQVIQTMINSYVKRSSAYLIYDLFENKDIVKALKTITQATGYDGIVVSHGENINPSKSKEKWIIAWYPEQIEIIKQ